jgi:hypothetical protein
VGALLHLACQFVDGFSSLLKITSAFAFKTLDSQFTAVFHYLDVLFTDWLVLALHIIVHDLWVFLVLSIFFNTEPEIFDLSLRFLSWGTWWLD